MQRREKLFWLCVGAVLIALFLSMIPSYYEICEVAEKTKEKDCTSYQVVPFLAIKIGQFLDRAGVAVTALATIAIAGFTLTLKRATDRLWDAGDKQLGLLKRSADISERALTELERPYLFILDYNWLLSEKAKAHDVKFGLVYSVANGGKLPAFIKAVKFGMRFGDSIPPLHDEPLVNDLLTAPLIGGGDQREVVQGFTDEDADPPLECQIRGGKAFVPAIAFKARRVIAKISIEYDGPVTSGHTITACWEWHPVKYAFTQYGGAEHNQRT